MVISWDSVAIWHFANTDWQVFWSSGSLSHYSPQYFMDPVLIWYSYWPQLEQWPLLIKGSLCLYHRVYSLLLELGRSRVPIPCNFFFCQMWLTSRLAVNRPTCYSLCPVSQCSVCAPLKHLKWRLLNYFHLGTLYWHGLNLIPIWMSNYIRYKVWDTAVGVWEWING